MYATAGDRGVGGGRNESNQWVLFFFGCWAASVEVFLHWGFGRRYLGGQAAGTVVLLAVLCALCPPYDARPMMGYLLGYLLMIVVHRAACLKREWGDAAPIHTRYSGRPLLLKIFPSWSEVAVKRFVEPAVVMVAGVAFMGIYPPLGFLWLFAGVCLLSIVNAAEAWYRQRATEMYDSIMDQQDVAERFRRMRKEEFF